MLNIKQRLKKDNGAVMIVEAVFVFPVVLFVVILLLVYGNMLYQQARMDSLAVRAAQQLAVLYTNPTLQKGAIPTDTTQVNVKPYRYLFGDGEAENMVKAFIDEQTAEYDAGFFSGMEIEDIEVAECKINNYVVYQTTSVQLNYSVDLFPMRLFDSPSVFRSSNATTVAATDSAEFIRNVDMIMDYSEEFGLTDKIKNVLGMFTGN